MLHCLRAPLLLLPLLALLPAMLPSQETPTARRVMQYGVGRLEDASVSPSGELLAYVTGAGTVIREAQDNRLLRSIEGYGIISWGTTSETVHLSPFDRSETDVIVYLTTGETVNTLPAYNH